MQANVTEHIGTIAAVLTIVAGGFGFLLRGYISKPDALRNDHDALSKVVMEHIRTCADKTKQDATILERITNLQRNFDIHTEQDQEVSREIRDELRTHREASDQIQESLNTHATLYQSLNVNFQRLVEELLGNSGGDRPRGRR